MSNIGKRVSYNGYCGVERGVILEYVPKNSYRYSRASYIVKHDKGRVFQVFVDSIIEFI